jgi:hypothetical protein
MKLSGSSFLIWKAIATTPPPEGGNAAESLDPFVPIRAMVKTLMPCRILASLLASGTPGSANLNSKGSVNYGAILLVRFKKMTDDAHGFFV